MRLAIVTTHPVQYYAPLFKLLYELKQMSVRVFYTWGAGAQEKYDPGFLKPVQWDLPLLEDYDYVFPKNSARHPGSHHFKGIVNPDLIEQLEFWQADAILVYGWAYHSHLKVLRHFSKRIPLLFRGDSTLLDQPRGIKKQARKFFLKWVYAHVDHALFAGSHNKAYFKKHGLKENQLTFSPHAVDNERFSINKYAAAQELRARFKIPEQDILLLFAGKFEQKKDPELLLRAFLGLNRQQLHLLFVGNGVLELVLKQKAKSYGQIHFLDFQNQQYMPVVYQACDLFCLPSSGPGETWGLAINEAMACSKAILASDKVGCATDLIKPGYNGEIFKAGCADSLSQHLNLLLIKNKKGLATMGRCSKKIINEWTFQKQVQAIRHVTAKYE
uniref:glycosyltransferase family 4 protein n=1 Tax=Pedobacter schmidteae TaxID=2201271 RepID=UPI000EB09A4C|nr:glycosyltransferase family 4 protein [Pedobacter schmidteae]